ncbi:MAG TPA: hypothetical protein VFF00_07220 [Candidatus Elarobacter sp.]|nr:hypothetical protein [Dongiaceae bacterium]HZW53807.1 hypothetical protein [Candidatus Elarobacter sp.]
MSASSPVADARAYRLPFELAGRTSGKIRCIIPSAKLSAGALETNRYYVDFTTLESAHAERDLSLLLDGLQLAGAARAAFDEEYARFRHLRFIGVGPSRGRMTYRLYVGFPDNFVASEYIAASIDWVPGESEYVHKRYDDLESVSRSRKLALIRESLGVTDGAGRSAAERVANAVIAIVDKAQGDLGVVLVHELSGLRRSVAFNYHRVAYTANDDLAAEIGELIDVFGIAPERAAAWRRATDALRVTDVSTGTGWDGAPFVTFYHGLLREPPPYRDSPDELSTASEDIMDTPAIAGPVDALGHPALGANPAVTPSHTCAGCAGSATPCAGCAGHEPEPPKPQPRPFTAQFVYALGALGYEFPNDARRESFLQQGLRAPDDPAQLLAFLEQNPWAAEDLYWTLRLGAVPIYAIRPFGAYAAETYQRLRRYLADQVAKKSLHVSVPGWMGSTAVLSNGMRVPVVTPDLRGLYNWTDDQLVGALHDPAADEPQPPPDSWRDQLRNLLSRIYYELRNTGVSGADRALNYAATNAFMLQDMFIDVARHALVFDRLSVGPSPFCAPGGECYDVVFEFFDPMHRTETAKTVYRYTIDVSDVLPVLVDQPRHWAQY